MPVSRRTFHVIVLAGTCLAGFASSACGGVVTTPPDAGADAGADAPADAMNAPDTMSLDDADAGGSADATNDIGLTTDAGLCPMSLPTAGAACPGEGVGCSYSAGADPCGVYALCTGGVWVEHADGC
jgi:hypothetical protein